MNALSRFAAYVEHAERLDVAAQKLGGLVLKVARPGTARDLASGTALGHPAHPFLVTAPIGAWTSALLCDAIGQATAAQTLTGLGVLTAIPTAATGLSDWADTTGAERRVGLIHLVVNSLATSCYASSWWARRRDRHAVGVALGIGGAALASAGGWLGGHLAYALGVGVDTNAFSGGPTEWTRVDGEPPESSEPVSVAADGVALMATKVDGVIRVLADRCSHRGGPLSDGDIADGCITCPWHASRFDVMTGDVKRGPATVPQPSYEVQVTEDGCAVRRDESRSLRNNSVRVH